MSKCVLEAHRGVGTDAPENTIAAFRLAASQGYGMIETDPKFTSDGVPVLLHDRTVNRTGRDPDGSKIETPTEISVLTFAEARRLDFGVFMGEKFRGEQLPSLDEALSFAKEYRMPLKIDNVLASANDNELETFFDIVEKSGAEKYVGFTASDIGFIKKILSRFPESVIHFDGVVSDKSLSALSALVPKKQLVVWMRFDNPSTSWNHTPPVNAESAEKIHRIGKLGVWLLREKSELDDAERLFSADYAETDGTLKP